MDMTEGKGRGRKREQGRYKDSVEGRKERMMCIEYIFFAVMSTIYLYVQVCGLCMCVCLFARACACVRIMCILLYKKKFTLFSYQEDGMAVRCAVVA